MKRVRRPHRAVVNSALLVLDVLFYNLCCVTTNRSKKIAVCPEQWFPIIFTDLCWIVSSYKSCCSGFDPVNQLTEPDIRCIVKQNMDMICFPIHFSDDNIFGFHGFSDQCIHIIFDFSLQYRFSVLCNKNKMGCQKETAIVVCVVWFILCFLEHKYLLNALRLFILHGIIYAYSIERIRYTSDVQN